MKKFIGIIFIMGFILFLFWDKKEEIILPFTNKEISSKKESEPKREAEDSKQYSDGPQSTDIMTHTKKQAKNKMNLIKGNLQVQKILRSYFNNRERLSYEKNILISQNLRATPKSSYRERFGELINEKAGFIIYKVSELGIDESYSIQSKSLPVIYDTSKNTFGILTGNIVLNIKKEVDVKRITRILGIQKYFLEDQMVFGKFSDLQRLLTLINKEDDIQNFEIEVIDSIEEPN